MELIFLAKNMSNTAFLFFIATYAMQIYELKPNFFLPYILVALVPFLCYSIESMGKPKAKYSPLVLLPIGFLFLTSWIEAVAVAVTMVYAVAVVKQGSYYDEYGTLFDSFKRNALIMIGATAFGMVFGVLSDFGSAVVPYVMIYLIGSVTELSMLRHNRQTLNEKRFKLFNGTMLAATCLAGFGMSSKLFIAAMAFVAGWVYKLLILPVIVVIGSISGLVVYAILWIFLGQADFKGVNIELGEMAYGKNNQIEATELVNYEWLLRIVIGIAILAVAIYFIRKFLQKIRTAPAPLRSESRESTKNQFAKRRDKDDRDAVRMTYRKFLDLLGKRNFVVRSCDTTQDIQNRITHEADTGLAAQLREVYIGVRYTDRQSTKEEADQAKALYSELKKHHK